MRRVNLMPHNELAVAGQFRHLTIGRQTVELPRAFKLPRCAVLACLDLRSAGRR